MLLMFIRSHLFICVLFFMILKGGSKKNLLHLCQSMFCFFPQKFHSLSPSVFLEFIFVYGVREYSNFILIFLAKEPVRCPPQWPFPASIPSISLGGFPFLPPSPVLTVCRVSACGCSVQYEVNTSNLVEVLVCISLIFSDADIFSCDTFKQ